MAYTPVEIRHVKLPRGLLGYRRGTVERLLLDIADSFEEVWRARADLADQVEHLESDIARYRELEQLLRATLVSAERSAHELRDQAKREAETILTEAHAEARAIERRARVEHEELIRAARRVRLQLRATLDGLDEVEEVVEAPEDEQPDGGAAPAAEAA
jgi:cell division initiation protein